MQKGLKTKGKAGRKKLAAGTKRQKLTTTIDPVVIQRAKKAGINISRSAEEGIVSAIDAAGGA